MIVEIIRNSLCGFGIDLDHLFEEAVYLFFAIRRLLKTDSRMFDGSRGKIVLRQRGSQAVREMRGYGGAELRFTCVLRVQQSHYLL